MTIDISTDSTGNGYELAESNCVNYVDLEPLEAGISLNAKMSKCEDLSRDYLQTLLNGATPKYLTTKVVSDVEAEAPAVDLELPISHGYYLQLDDLIPVKLSNSTYVASSNDLLRPTTRLLCRIGRSLVAEQYRRIMPGKMRLHGVKPVKMSQEAHSMERELLQRTLPGAGVAISRLRWNWKDLEGLYESTCVRSGCCFETNSYESLVGHLRMGHYRMEEILEEAEDALDEVRSPCLYYPINPARMREVQSTSKNCYWCRRMHHGSRSENGEMSVFEPCIFCGELVKRESSQLLVCRLHLQSKSATLLWSEVGRYLHCDPARTIGAHALASLMLYPSEKSPLLFVKCVADRVQARCEQSLEGLSQRLTSALSAFRGNYHFGGMGAYTRVVGKAVDIEEMDLQLRISLSIKRRQPDEAIEDGESKQLKKPRLIGEISAMVDLKEQMHAVGKSSSDESIERRNRNKVIVIQNPFSGMDSTSEGKKSSSQHEPPSILRVIRPPQQSSLMGTSEQTNRTGGSGDVGSGCKNPLIVRPPAVVVVSESCTLPDSSKAMASSSQNRCPIVWGNKSADSSSLRDRFHASASGITSQSKTALNSVSRAVILPKVSDSVVKVASTLQPVMFGSLDSSKSSKFIPRVMTVTHTSPRPNSEIQKPIVLRIPKPSDGSMVTSVQNGVPTLSTQTATSCGDAPPPPPPPPSLTPSSRLASKILGVNLTQSNSTASVELNPQGGYHLQVGQKVSSVSNNNGSGQVVRKTLSPTVWESVTSRNIAEEVAKKVAQRSSLSSLSLISSETVPRRKQQLLTSQASLVPKGANWRVNKDGLNHGNISPLNLLRKPSSCVNQSSDRKSVEERSNMNIQPVIIRRRRARKHINVTASNGEHSSEGPGPSYPFESPESVNLIANWLKRSGTDISKVKPSEIPPDIAALFGLKNAGASSADCEHKDGYICRFCEMSFERIEILWAHCVRSHPEKKFSADCLIASPSSQSDPNRPASFSVMRPSAESLLSNKEASSQRHLPNSSSDTKAVVKSLSMKAAQSLKENRLEGESMEQRWDQRSGQSGCIASSSGDGSGESWRMSGGEDEMSLMCPMCSFSSSSRDVIMKHVVESH
ncbi:hypothetical protein Aperf_G00000083547 [Anoplocephala perfoliata]